MKKLILILLTFTVFSCAKNYDPANSLTKVQQDSLIYSVIRYSAKLPPNSNHDIKFDPQFDKYYKAVATDYDVRAYVKQGDEYYFLLTRAARSITPMRESIGVKMKVVGDSIAAYEEVFRTWKMPEETMNERFPVLFEKMLNGESLEAYYPKSTGDKYIEFPDGRFHFDKTERKWRDELYDSLNVTGESNL
jgi:hypothetical protein